MTETIAHKSGLYEPFSCDEYRYEKQIATLAEHIFPGFYWCDFKAEIRSDYGNVHGDAALIAHDYTQWYVVEVELESHSWENHVRPQLEKLLVGRYEKRHKEVLLQNNPKLDPLRVRQMEIYHPHVALVIRSAPQLARGWCRQNSVLCLEASPFRSSLNEYALALVGERPSIGYKAVRKPSDAVLRLDQTSSMIPQMTYLHDCSLCNCRQPFVVQVGTVEVNAQNFGAEPTRLVLTCERGIVEREVGASTMVDLTIISPGVYRMSVRNTDIL